MEQGEIWKKSWMASSWYWAAPDNSLRSQTPAEAWECPEVKSKHLRGKVAVPASQTMDVQVPVAGG